MIGICKGLLARKAAEWRLPSDGDWNFVIHNNYHPHSSTLNVMWFHNGAEFPSVVVKFCGDPGPLAKEFDNMQRAHSRMPGVVPRPLDFAQQGRLWGLWMEGVPGLRLSAAQPPSARLLGLVDLAASMHEGFRALSSRPDPERYWRMVKQPLEVLARFGSSASVKEGCAELAATTSPEWLDALPIVPQHGDFYADNILIYRDRFSIVDWEFFGKIDLPFSDLTILLFSLFRTKGSDTTLLPALVRSYAQRIDLSAGDLSVLFPLALVNWFHAQFQAGRKTLEPSYRAIASYFENPEPWKRAFRPV